MWGGAGPVATERGTKGPLNGQGRPVRLRNGVGRWAPGLAAAVLAGCVTLPGQVSSTPFVPRIVDREYRAVWQTLQATLRNEGAVGLAGDPERGVMQTAFRIRPGTKVLARGLLGEEETRNNMVQVRYAVQARPLGPQRTEVQLRTEVQYLDRASRMWVRAADDGSLMDSFWRRFEQDLAYYGVRPDTWRPDGPGREASPADAGPARGAPGREAPRAEPR